MCREKSLLAPFSTKVPNWWNNTFTMGSPKTKSHCGFSPVLAAGFPYALDQLALFYLRFSPFFSIKQQ